MVKLFWLSAIIILLMLIGLVNLDGLCGSMNIQNIIVYKLPAVIEEIRILCEQLNVFS